MAVQAAAAGSKRSRKEGGGGGSGISLVDLLAAGYLMQQQYGIVTTGSTKDSTNRFTQARAMLDRIVARTLPLVDYQGNLIAIKPLFNGWPDDTTALYNTNNPDAADPIGGDRLNRISSVF